MYYYHNHHQTCHVSLFLTEEGRRETAFRTYRITELIVNLRIYTSVLNYHIHIMPYMRERWAYLVVCSFANGNAFPQCQCTSSQRARLNFWRRCKDVMSTKLLALGFRKLLLQLCLGFTFQCPTQLPLLCHLRKRSRLLRRNSSIFTK